MHPVSPDTTRPGPGLEQRIQALFQDSQDQIYRRTDRLFALLMIFQWLAGIAAALWISPRTWIGATSHVHWHVWAAIFLGGLITSLPVFLAWKQPGAALTRHSIAAAQMIFSALLIHLTGGRIETHFHIFGSLAFLAFYRDWRVLITATILVAADHFARGVFWPQSIFGIASASYWRWLEHAGWVVFEDTFLIISIRQSLGEMREVATRRAKLEEVNTVIEQQVAERTAALTIAHHELLEASRRAGMAEVATGVLHNVGNVLNSLNVSASLITTGLRQSKAGSLASLAALLAEHSADLPVFLTTNPKGRRVPEFLALLARQSLAERDHLLQETAALQQNVDHLKEIISMQQTCATMVGSSETLETTALFEDSLKMNAGSLLRHEVRVVREFSPVAPVQAKRAKVLQILINLIRNAEQACEEGPAPDKVVTLGLEPGPGGCVRLFVRDNGTGIAPENLTRIFAHGFTTKATGHGFGLHSAANAAKEMKGRLTAHSDGPDKGATFILELPGANLPASAMSAA